MNIRLLFIFTMLFYATSNYAQKEKTSSSDYILPDILKTINGKNITTQKEWVTERRPEIIKLFEDNVFGQMPKNYDRIEYNITHEVSDTLHGKANFKEVDIIIWKGNKSIELQLTLFTPLSKKLTSVFLLMEGRKKTIINYTKIIESGHLPEELAIDNNFAFAVLYVNGAAPDNEDTYQNGVLKLYPEQLTLPSGMKAMGSWAWAASRAIDYFETDNTIDAKRVYLVGHSRYGKASLWAGAQDQRIAMVFSSCSGNTGAALSRSKVGESVKAINTKFPYWFTDNYKKFNDNIYSLPVDQHMLIALIAPRPLYTTSATEDLWADPESSYISICKSQKVYRLYNKKSRLTIKPPLADVPIVNSILGYHIRTGVHDLTPYDWSNFIKFAMYHNNKE